MVLPELAEMSFHGKEGVAKSPIAPMGIMFGSDGPVGRLPKWPEFAGRLRLTLRLEVDVHQGHCRRLLNSLEIFLRYERG